MRSKVYIGFVFILLFAMAGNAQNYADSTQRIADENQRRQRAMESFEKARTNLNDSNPAAALRYYLSALYDFEVLGDSLKMAETNAQTGHLFMQNKLFEKASQYLGNAELIWLKLGQIEQHSPVLLDLGKTYFALQDYTRAVVYFERIQDLNNPGRSILLQSYQGQLQCLDQLKYFDKALMVNRKILDMALDSVNLVLQISAYTNEGYLYQKKKMWSESLSAFEKAAQIEEDVYGSVQVPTLINQAIVYQNAGNNMQALDKLNRAASMTDSRNDRAAAMNNYLTALVYFNMKDYYNAQVYNKQCLTLCQSLRVPQLLSDAWLLSSKIHEALYDFEGAAIDYRKHLSLSDSLERRHAEGKKELAETAFLVERISQETERLWADQEISKLSIEQLRLDSVNRIQEIHLLRKNDSLQKATIQNEQLEKNQALQQLLLREEQVFAAKKAKEVDSLRQIEKIQGLELETQRLVQEEQKNQIKLLDQEKQISELNLKKVKTRNKYLFAFALLVIIILYLVYRGLRFARKANRLLIKQNNEIERQKDEIERQRQRSDKLLLNILPEETAEELKEKGEATPRHYDKVSVLFTDFKGFTQIAEKLSPQQLVAELNSCFLAFDKIIDKYGLEKIKTIGDAYMCAGGIPVANTTNPHDIVKAALEIRGYMQAMKEEREAQGEAYWELRIGIHTGEVIAGVVGKNKFAYDIWGDAVNTASRMESSGIPGKVNISGTTHAFINDRFKCTYRGKVKAKNKGEIDMYIVEKERGV